MKKRKKIIVVILVVAVLMSACTAVKPYQRVNLNDPDMTLEKRKSTKFQTTFHGYREASSGATSGKSSGGCGCN